MQLYSKIILCLVFTGISAQNYQLDCVEGELQCATKPCVTVIFNNVSDMPQSIRGTLKAKLVGAARLVDNKFDFARRFPVGKTSCHIPTQTLRRFAKHVQVSLYTKNGVECHKFMPKGAFKVNSGVEALIRDGSCIIHPLL